MACIFEGYMPSGMAHANSMAHALWHVDHTPMAWHMPNSKAWMARCMLHAAATASRSLHRAAFSNSLFGYRHFINH
jgi:hypothetical protein